MFIVTQLILFEKIQKPVFFIFTWKLLRALSLMNIFEKIKLSIHKRIKVFTKKLLYYEYERPYFKSNDNV